MTETTTERDRLDEAARFIYEPVLDGLDRVVGNLGELAESSGVRATWFPTWLKAAESWCDLR